MNSNLTELIVILDASGSMGKRKQDVIGGFNQLLCDQKALPGDCVVTVVQFSTHGKQRTIIDRKSVFNTPYLTDGNYRASGWTALYDAIGSTVDEVGIRLSETPENERPGRVIVAVVTDGEENDSKEYTVDQVREKVTHQQDVYNWEFLFTGANQNAILEGTKLGFKSDLSANYADSNVGYGKLFLGLSHATCALRSNDRDAACSCMKGIEND